MVIQLLDKYLQNQGYIACKTEYPQIKEYCKEENSCVNILQLVDLKKDCELTNEQFIAQKSKISEAINKDVHILSLVFYENYSDALACVWDEYMCWLIDRQNLTFADNSDRVEDFYGLKEELGRWLIETKALIQSGDVNAISRKLMSDQEREVYLEKQKKKPSPVSVSLVVINVIIYCTYFIIGEPFITSGQMNFELVSQGQIYRLVTAMFLHGGIQHIAGNMILLYFLGQIIENKTGSVKYGIIYLVSGIMGNVVSYLYEMVSGARYVSVGASGAVYGLIGALIYLVIRKTQGLNIDKKRLFLMVAYCIYSSFATEHIDFAAHLGGMLFGFIVTALLCPKGGKAEGES